MRNCPVCGRKLEDWIELCPFCGAELPPLTNALPAGALVYNRYFIDRVIGIGGFSITYQARDVKLNATIALKEYFPSGIANRIPGSSDVILYAGKMASQFRHGFSRFLEEAQNLMKFQSHPNIVQVREYFEENGTAYIVMEYLPGTTLKDAIGTNGISPEKAVEIGTVICDALKVIHGKKILHRDVSPDNIFLCDDGRIKLIDFGAARFSFDEGQHLTVIFKESFAPPEQYSKSEMQGQWTDVYALGATLYMALTGRKPDSSLDRRSTDRLPPPQAIRPDVPEAIGNAVMRAMALEKELRFPTAEAFSDALNQHYVHMNVEEHRKKKRRVVRISVISTFLILFLLLAVLLGMWAYRVKSGTLPNCVLSVWYTAELTTTDGQNKMEALTALKKTFQRLYPNVSIQLLAVPEAEYAQKLKDSVKDGSTPAVFEYIKAENALPIDEKALEKVVKTLDKKAYFGYVDKARIPSSCVYAGYSIPVLYTSSAVEEDSIEACRRMDASILAGITAGTVGVQERCLSLYSRILERALPAFGVSDGYQKEKPATAMERFIDGSAVVLYGLTADYAVVQSDMAGKYKVWPLLLEDVLYMPENQWSITDDISSDERECAIRFLQFMLEDAGQECLYLQNRYPAIPIHLTTMETYRKLYAELAAIIETEDHSFLID